MKNETSVLEAMSDAISVSALFDRKIAETILGAYDALSPYTVGRTRKMIALSGEIAREMGFDDASINEVEIASMLCDIGMWAMPPEILGKKGRLTLSEFRVIQMHTELSLKAVEDVKLTDDIRKAIFHSHESYDGSGYPGGLKGDSIPPGAQIVNASSTLYALTAQRPYRDPVSPEKAVQIIESEEKKQFHPNIVKACQKLLERKIIKSILEEKSRDPFALMRKELVPVSDSNREQKKCLSEKLTTDDSNSDENKNSLDSLRTQIGK